MKKAQTLLIAIRVIKLPLVNGRLPTYSSHSEVRFLELAKLA
jgi:hypothetical protein